jgi:hypothetical protein
MFKTKHKSCTCRRTLTSRHSISGHDKVNKCHFQEEEKKCFCHFLTPQTQKKARDKIQKNVFTKVRDLSCPPTRGKLGN